MTERLSTMTLTHDDNGNLTDDGVYKYTYDALNRLTQSRRRVDAETVVAAYEYDGLFRRTVKAVSNSGAGIVAFSDDLDMNGTADADGTQAGNRSEHYYYSGWRLVETRDGSDNTLGQFVYGTRYIDEPICYDRNTDLTFGGSADDDCLDASGSQRYMYHQDANWRVVALTDESGAVVERYDYTAYGEPTILCGTAASAVESGNALLVSSVGNPLTHQGLFRDDETSTYQNRFRQLHSRSGRFMQRDPLAQTLASNSYIASTLGWIDPFGLLLFEDPPSTQPSSGPVHKHPTPGQPVDRIEHHVITPTFKLNFTGVHLDDWGHGWVEVGGSSWGYWPDGIHSPDDKQEELDRNTMDPNQMRRHKRIPWVFDPHKLCGYGPQKGKPCATFTVHEIQWCVEHCAMHYAGDNGSWDDSVGRVCHNMPVDCLNKCCMSAAASPLQLLK